MTTQEQQQSANIRTVQIPLTDSPWPTLQVPYPMSEDAWEEMLAFLALMKRPLTASGKATKTTDDNAKQASV